MILSAQLWPKSSTPESAAALAGERFVFLHGMGGTGALWRPIAAQLEDRAVILAPDQRGHGGSRPVNSSDFSPEAFGADVIDTMRHYRFVPAWIVGHSMGVRSAVAAAHADPSAAKGLVLIDLGLSGAAGGGLGDSLARFIQKLPEEFASRAEARSFMDAECPDPSMAQYLMAVSQVESAGENSGRVTFPFDHAALIATIDAARDSSARDWLIPLAEDGMPILVLRGANSEVLSAAEFAAEEKAFARFPNVIFETFENAGHGLPFEQRAKFVARLKEFTGI